MQNLGSASRNGSRRGLLRVGHDDVEGAVDLGRVVLAVADVDSLGGRHHLAPAAGLHTAR